MDEPTVGLDPIQIIEIRDLIRKLGETHTVILSSHILSEVQAICEQVLIISKGKLVAFDTPENLEKILTQSNGIHFTVQASPEDVEQIMQDMEGIGAWECTDQEDGSVAVHVITEVDELRETGCKIFFAFAEKMHPIFEMSSKKASLEDVFIELTEGTGQSASGQSAEKETTAEKMKKESEVAKG